MRGRRFAPSWPAFEPAPFTLLELQAFAHAAALATAFSLAAAALLRVHSNRTVITPARPSLHAAAAAPHTAALRVPLQASMHRARVPGPKLTLAHRYRKARTAECVPRAPRSVCRAYRSVCRAHVFPVFP